MFGAAIDDECRDYCFRCPLSGLCRMGSFYAFDSLSLLMSFDSLSMVMTFYSLSQQKHLMACMRWRPCAEQHDGSVFAIKHLLLKKLPPAAAALLSICCIVARTTCEFPILCSMFGILASKSAAVSVGPQNKAVSKVGHPVVVQGVLLGPGILQWWHQLHHLISRM